MVFLFLTRGVLRTSHTLGRLATCCPAASPAGTTLIPVLNRNHFHQPIAPHSQLHHPSIVSATLRFLPSSSLGTRHWSAQPQKDSEKDPVPPVSCEKKKKCPEKVIDVDYDAEKGVCFKTGEDEQKLGLVAKFKQMYKKYWYILVPVHLITSTGWLVGFYYLSCSGVDIPTLLDKIHLNATLVDKLRDSAMGHIAITYLCYKIVTPLRYMVTLGGTTISIKYLSQWGYIKPMPSKAQLKQMYEDRKDARAKRKQDSNLHE